MELVLAPVFQEYVVAPLAVRLTEVPAQIVVGELTVIVGFGLTVTDVVFVFEQPELVPVIV